MVFASLCHGYCDITKLSYLPCRIGSTTLREPIAWHEFTLQMNYACPGKIWHSLISLQYNASAVLHNVPLKYAL